MKKINLIYGSGDVLDSHININPFEENPNDTNIIRGDVSNLDQYADDAELDELSAVDVIDYFPLNSCEDSLSNWFKKIRIGGKIIIGGVDLFEVCKSFSQYRIDITEANRLIHGEQQKPYMFRKANFTALGISEYISEKFGFKIIKKRINNYHMIIESERQS